MKRTPLVVVFFFFSILYCRAQFKVAFVGGGHQSKIIEDNDLPGWDTLKNHYSGRTGVHFGFTANIAFGAGSNFYFQPSVLFYNKGRNYHSNPVDTSVRVSRDQLPDTIISTVSYNTGKNYLNYVDIPLNVVYKYPLSQKLSVIVGAGPYLSLFYNGFDKKSHIVQSVSTVSETNDDLPIGKGSNKYSTVDYGINGLAGVEYDRLTLTANYSRGLKNFYEPADYAASNYKHQVMGATLGVYFGKSVPPAPKDRDGDGTPDKTDKCPDIAGPVSLLGCPDADNDGITDAEDKCPGEAGPADNKGCPYPDRDGDKVFDKDDKCPDIAGAVDNNGCPYPDSDNDGVLDKEDKCPAVAGLAKYGGCPVPDTDNDGVNDEEDKCPDVLGTKENNGCPEIQKEVQEKIEYSARQIEFIMGSSQLSKGSFEVLDTVAAILKRNPDIKVSIEGHTSSEGSVAGNMKLSQTRADKVRDYLLRKGIEASRLTTAGFGSSKLLNEDKTPADKAKNRRVELKLSNQ
jgi:OmpA-OmpF porin, OOP family